MAKLHALMSGESLILMPIDKSKGWSAGLMLLRANSRHQYSPNENIIYQWQWSGTNVHISWHGLQSKQYLLFATDLKSSMINGYFEIKNPTQQIQLIVNRLGRITCRW